MRVARLFTPDHERYDGVRPINVYVLRVMFLLIVLFVGSDAWSALLTHEGEWDRFRAAAVSMWAAFALLAILGVVNPLKMLPLVLFEIAYKLIWLAAVAYPLWSAGKLAGSPAEPMAYAFAWVLLPIVATPWGYVIRRYFRRAASA